VKTGDPLGLAILLKKVYKFQDVRIEQKPTEPVLPG
jgi:hypothetical protein